MSTILFFLKVLLIAVLASISVAFILGIMLVLVFVVDALRRAIKSIKEDKK